MIDVKAEPCIPINLYEIATIVFETFSGLRRPDGLEPKEAMDQVLDNPKTRAVGVASMIAAQQIGAYMRTSCQTTAELIKIGLL